VHGVTGIVPIARKAPRYFVKAEGKIIWG